MSMLFICILNSYFFFHKWLYLSTLKSSSYWTPVCFWGFFTSLFFCRSWRSSSDRVDRFTGIIMMRLGSLYRMPTVDPSGRTNITGYTLSYLCRPQHATDALLELSWGIWVWSSLAWPCRCERVNKGQTQLPILDNEPREAQSLTINMSSTVKVAKLWQETLQ